MAEKGMRKVQVSLTENDNGMCHVVYVPESVAEVIQDILRGVAYRRSKERGDEYEN